MENNSYHVPFYVVTGGVKTSGHSSELNGGGVGLYDRATFSVATSTGNGKEFFFAQGNIGGKDWYGYPITQTTHKSAYFLGKDVDNMYLSRPKTIQNEEWVIGYNGSATSKSLVYETGKPIRVKMYFHGNPIYRFFGGPKEYLVSYTPPEDCTAPCAEGDCPDPITDCLTHTQALIDMINNHTELQKFGVRATHVVSPYVAGSPNMEVWQLSVCDTGTAQALQAVQAQAVAGVTVERISRTGSTSVYQFCQLGSAADPSDFTQTGAILLSDCGTCPSGSTLSSGIIEWFVTRPLAGTEDIDDSTARQTFADAIGTQYETNTKVTFAGTVAAVDVATDIITMTAHGFLTGDKVTYSNGGGTSITGITSGNDYYVIRLTVDTIALATTAALAFAGTKRDLTVVGVGVSHTLTPVITAAFVSRTGGSALVKLTTTSGVELTAYLGDTVVQGASRGAICTFSDPSAIAWVSQGTTGFRSSRTMRINALQRPDCNTSGDRLADLTAILTGVTGIDISTLTKIAGTACVDDYTVVQNSVDCLPAEACLSNNVTFHYEDLPAFENKSWVLVPVVVSPDATRKCGIRISAGYIDPKFGNCSFDPTDYYENLPLKMEVSLLGEDDSACDTALWPSVHQSKIGRIARQSGEWVVREVIMKTDAYIKHIDQYSNDPRMREAFDMNLLTAVDRKAFYNLYYVTFRASYGIGAYRKNEQEKFTAVFAFKEGDASAATFESNVLNVLTGKSGVVMHTID